MTTVVAESGQLIRIYPSGDRLAQARSSTLIKTGAIEVIRMVPYVGKKIALHQAPTASNAFQKEACL